MKAIAKISFFPRITPLGERIDPWDRKIAERSFEWPDGANPVEDMTIEFTGVRLFIKRWCLVLKDKELMWEFGMDDTTYNSESMDHSYFERKKKLMDALIKTGWSIREAPYSEDSQHIVIP